MEQLLALDFTANESLLRGLVTFAALGLITVVAGPIPVEPHDAEGEHIDPLAPPYVKQAPIAPPVEAYVPKKEPLPDNSWPDPLSAPPKKSKFVPGPALAAFEAEESAPPPAQDEGVFQFAAPAEERVPPPGDAFAAAQAAFAAWTAQHERGSAPSDAVPRKIYEALLTEKQELQQRLYAAMEERNKSDAVPRELFDQAQAEKRQLQEKMMLMLDERLRLRQQPAAEKEKDRGNVRPFPGSRKNAGACRTLSARHRA